jgi:ribosomal protein S1
LKFKIWTLDVQSQKASLTHKKTILTSTLPTITSYASAARGMVTHGVITSVKELGCIVEFYNGVHGLVSVKDLRKVSGLGEKQSPLDAYHKGQVMKVRVKKSVPTEKKLLLSFSTTKHEEEEKGKGKWKGLQVRVDEVSRCLPAGAFVSGTVRGLWPKKETEKKNGEEKKEGESDDDADEEEKKPGKENMVSQSEELKVEVVINEMVDADDATSEGKEEKGKSKKAAATKGTPKTTIRRVFECVLAAEHLTDHPVNVVPLLALTQKEGTILDNLCVLYVDREGRAHLTAKPSLLTALDTRQAKTVPPVVSTPVASAANNAAMSLSDDDEDTESSKNETKEGAAAKLAERKRRASLKILGTPTTPVKPTAKKGSVKGKNGTTEKPSQVPIEPPSNAVDGPDPSQVPESFDDVHVNMLLCGYVRQVVGYGVFVGFRGSLVGLAPRAHLCDQFVTQPSHHFATGQSVRARVIEVDREKKQFLVTLKPSQTSFSLDSDGAFVRSFFDERARIDKANGAPATASVDWSLFPFGSRVTGTVATVKDVGVLLTFPTLGAATAPVKSAAKKKAAAPASTSSGAAGVMGLAVVSQTGEGKGKKKPSTATSTDGDDDDDSKEVKSVNLKDSYKVGQTVDCRVLDVSRTRGIVDVSLRRDLLSSTSGGAKAKTMPQLGSVVQVEVQLVQKDYLVCSLPKFDNSVGFASTTSYNLRVSPHSLFKAGQRFDAYVYAVPDDKVNKQP